MSVFESPSETVYLYGLQANYKLNDKPAVLIVRPRGWHLSEKNFKVNNEETSGSLFDFGVYLFHNYILC